MTNDGWIYILKGWDRLYVHQSGPRSRPPWPFVKNETALLDDPDYLRLSCQERAWLHGIWMLAGKHGQGRVSAGSRYLRGQLGVRKGALEPLIQAGWIEVRASKAQALSKAKAKLEEEDAPKQEGEETNARARPPRQPDADTPAASIQAENTQIQAENTQAAIEHLLIACNATNDGGARVRLTTLTIDGATERHYQWAAGRLRTANGIKNPVGYAIGVIRNELDKERATA